VALPWFAWRLDALRATSMLGWLLSPVPLAS
jgi:hypothetical protein